MTLREQTTAIRLLRRFVAKATPDEALIREALIFLNNEDAAEGAPAPVVVPLPIAIAWYWGDSLRCRRCKRRDVNAGQLDQCPGCGFARFAEAAL